GAEFVAAAGVPNLQRAVLAAGEDASAVGAPRHAGQIAPVALEGEYLLALFCIPDRGIVDKSSAVGVPEHVPVPVRATGPPEGADLLALLGIPHLHRHISAAAEDTFAVWAPGHAHHPA